MTAQAHSAFGFRVGILGLNTTFGLAGASPAAPPTFGFTSDALRIDAPIAIGADVTVAAGRELGTVVLGPGSACGIASCSLGRGAEASVDSEATASPGPEVSAS
jgi:hypothetical protein